MDDDNNFFAVAPGDGAPEGEAPPADDGADFFGAPPADDVPAAASFIGDVNETDDTDAFAAPPTEDTPIILGGAPPEAVEDGSEPEEPEPEEPVFTGPSPMSIWNDEWQATLLARKDEENAKKAEMLEAASLALDNFKKEYDMKREAKLAKNREDEQEKLEAIEADLENDNSWQKVCKMVELSHDSTEKAEDVKRMRDALILLKNDPARAEVLGAV